MDKPDFQSSADTRLLYQRLKKVAVGQIITYEDLSATVSRPLAEIRGALATARIRLLRDDHVLFGVVRGIGLKRLVDAEIVDGATADTNGIRRKARRAVEKLSKVSDFAALTPARQLEWTTRTSVLGAIASMTRETSIERVRSAAQGRSTELPLAETIRAFASPTS